MMKLILRSLLILSAIAFVLTGCANNRELYRGSSQNGIPHGQGWKLMPNGEKYVGEWGNGMMSGRGIYTWPNGQRYEGEFSNDSRTGQGTMEYANHDRYEGEWSDNKKSGKGLMAYANGDRYEGSWSDDERSGQGVMVYADRSRYEGNWAGNQQNGKGALELSNGNYYMGYFVSDSHGNGDAAAMTYYYPKGESKWCLENCAQSSNQYAIVAGAFSATPEEQQVRVTPCGTDRAACMKRVAPTLVALEQLRVQQALEAEQEKARKEAAAIAAIAKEKADKEAAILAEQKRIADEKQRVIDERHYFLAHGSAAELSVDADNLEAKKDYAQATEVYGIVVKRFPDSPYASQAMSRRAAMRDKVERQEADAKREAADAARSAKEERERAEERAVRKAEAEERAAQAQAATAAAAQNKTSLGAELGRSVACIACDQLDGFAKMACKAMSCK